MVGFVQACLGHSDRAVAGSNPALPTSFVFVVCVCFFGVVWVVCLDVLFIDVVLDLWLVLGWWRRVFWVLEVDVGVRFQG